MSESTVDLAAAAPPWRGLSTRTISHHGFVTPPTIVCGAHGGGTSYLTKMLRFAGFFAGRDAGAIEARKFHESASFKQVNYSLGNKAGDRDMLSPRAIHTVEAELHANLGYWRSTAIERMAALGDEYAPRRSGSFLQLLWPVLRTLNRCFPGVRWTWPGYAAWWLGTRDTTQPWGWKDPRNSVTLPLWLSLFPDSRVLVINKAAEGGEARSPSGAWFRDPANAHQIRRYQNPVADQSCQRVLRVNFEEVTASADRFNEVLRWLGIPVLTRRQFRGLLKVTRFEH